MTSRDCARSEATDPVAAAISVVLPGDGGPGYNRRRVRLQRLGVAGRAVTEMRTPRGEAARFGRWR